MSMSTNQQVAGYHVYQIYTMRLCVMQHFFDTQSKSQHIFYLFM